MHPKRAWVHPLSLFSGFSDRLDRIGHTTDIMQ